MARLMNYTGRELAFYEAADVTFDETDDVYRVKPFAMASFLPVDGSPFLAAPRKTGHAEIVHPEYSQSVEVWGRPNPRFATYNLPDPEPDTLLVVNPAFRAGLPERQDLVTPGEPVYDTFDDVVGYLGVWK